jgi:hypothetical protein
MNQNSSRYGKYLQLNFTDTGRIVGGRNFQDLKYFICRFIRSESL